YGCQDRYHETTPGMGGSNRMVYEIGGEAAGALWAREHRPTSGLPVSSSPTIPTSPLSGRTIQRRAYSGTGAGAGIGRARAERSIQVRTPALRRMTARLATCAWVRPNAISWAV